ncbi:Cx9C motif-containing protein 4, mitochondrial [Orbilia brochopaga]|uniref:Cx9C motif-containing protein 4, mitochondrial n=1 Tax=Orbilia brochopaga TaxID=3140254 RepID=A0AAV9UNJ8_9PEZI
MGISIDEAIKQDPPCYSKACAIQSCIQKNNFDESKCQDQIDALYACCAEFYRRKGRDAKSVSCPKPNLLDLKIKQRKEERENGGSGSSSREAKRR